MSFKERLTDWGHLDIRDARSGAKFEAHGMEWTIVRIASGTAKNPTSKRARGHSHVVATTDGLPAKLYEKCHCSGTVTEALVMDIVTESFWRVCSKCRALTLRGRGG
jgi:DnaJ-class molecular chaperone